MSPSPSPVAIISYIDSKNLIVLDTSDKCNHAVFVFLWVAYFTSNNILGSSVSGIWSSSFQLSVDAGEGEEKGTFLDWQWEWDNSMDVP